MAKIFRIANRWLRSDNPKSKTCPEPRRRIKITIVGLFAMLFRASLGLWLRRSRQGKSPA